MVVKRGAVMYTQSTEMLQKTEKLTKEIEDV